LFRQQAIAGWHFNAVRRTLPVLRLRQNIDQQRLAEQAGVALNVVKRLEGGKGTTVASLIKILRARAGRMADYAGAGRLD
jgi:transcriptional regulator with XRE-family HTH domain